MIKTFPWRDRFGISNYFADNPDAESCFVIAEHQLGFVLGNPLLQNPELTPNDVLAYIKTVYRLKGLPYHELEEQERRAREMERVWQEYGQYKQQAFEEQQRYQQYEYQYRELQKQMLGQMAYRAEPILKVDEKKQRWFDWGL